VRPPGALANQGEQRLRAGLAEWGTEAATSVGRKLTLPSKSPFPIPGATETVIFGCV
jgi:hypothetical protein